MYMVFDLLNGTGLATVQLSKKAVQIKIGRCFSLYVTYICFAEKINCEDDYFVLPILIFLELFLIIGKVK